eukprot:scaffold2.g7487.t1
MAATASALVHRPCPNRLQHGRSGASLSAPPHSAGAWQRRCRSECTGRRLLLAAAALGAGGAAAGGRGDHRLTAAQAAVAEAQMSVTMLQQPGQQQYGAAPRSHVGPPAFVKVTGRIVAIGDIHGDLHKALLCLEMAGVLDEDEGGRVKWVGGDTTVVQLGDVLDRGDSEIATILLLRELDRQARAQGGAVWMLNGNHESLNVAGDFRYVTPGAFWESAVAAGMREADVVGDQQGVLRARWALYRPGGQMARELARNPTVLVVNDVVFAHGGLLPTHLKYGLQRINDEVSAWMFGVAHDDGSSAQPPFPAMGDANSVMWNRTFGKERISEYDRVQMNMQLNGTLSALGASVMVVGHTPQMGGLNAECGGRVWRVDAGMSSGVLDAEPQVLELTRNEEGALVARALRMQAGGVVARELVYSSGPRAPGGAAPGLAQDLARAVRAAAEAA